MSQFDELPDGWEKSKIGDLCTLINGKAFKPDDWTDVGLKIVRIQNLNKEDALFNHFSGEVDSKFIIEDGELLFAWSGTPGTSFGAHIWSRGKAVLNQHIFRVVFDESHLDKIFFRHAINQKLQELIGKAHGGVGLRHVTKGKFEQTAIPLPPLNEQRRIVEKIEALTARSRKARAALDEIPALLDQFRQSVLVAAFRGDLTADWRAQNPDVETAEALLEQVLAADKNAYKEENIKKALLKGKKISEDESLKGYKNPPSPKSGMLLTNLKSNVPESWIIGSLESISQLITGKTPSTQEENFWNGDIPFVTPSEIHPSGSILEPKRKVTDLGAKEARLIPPFSTLVVCIGTVGKSGYLDQKSIINQQVNALVPHSEIMSSKYLFYWAQALKPWIVANARATVNAAILNKSGLGVAPIPIPPHAEQLKIVNSIETALQKIEEIQQFCLSTFPNLDSLDRSILAKAFRGELVLQDLNDEPAAVLLDRIRAERERLGSGKKRGKAKA